MTAVCSRTGSIGDTHGRDAVFPLLIGVGLAVLSFTGDITEVHVIVTAFMLQNRVGHREAVGHLAAAGGRAARSPAEAFGLNTLQFIDRPAGRPSPSPRCCWARLGTLAFSINAATFLGPILAMLYMYSRGLGGTRSA